MATPGPAARGRLESRPDRAPAPPVHPPGVRRLDLGPEVEVLLAVPRAEGPSPLLVFFHGAGGSADDALTLIGAAAEQAGVALLAPTSAGRTWDLLTGGLGRDVAVLDAALHEAFGAVPVSRVAVGGFSDGASYALSLGLANGDLFETVLALSPGFAAPPARVGRPRVWLSSGTRDRVLPVDRCGRRVARLLGAEGLDVVYQEFDGGHVVPPGLADAALRAWLGAG
jgi:phospholipase/carboxylesterase